MRTRLLREAHAMARLKHPNVLTVHEVGTEGDRDFIVMELVDGGPLDHWLAFGPEEAEVMAALLAAGRGLAAAHAAGLVHRDFKPNNVLRSRAGRVLVTDFGLARGLGDDAAPGEAPELPAVNVQSVDSVLHSPLTRTGAMIGTPAYMAPEQYAGHPPDPRTDQFAYCITAWQALTGARPFHGKTLEELRDAASAGVEAVVADLPKPVRAVLARGLDPDPAKRWPDLDTLLGELEAVSKPARSYKGLAIVAGVAVLVLVVGLWLAKGGDTAPVIACEPATAVYADADKLQQPLPAIAPMLAEHRTRWFAEYEAACKTPQVARIDCLVAVRDRTEAVARLADRGKWYFDPLLVLPHPSACVAKTPVVPPALPPEPARGEVLRVLGDTLALGNVRLGTDAPILETRARALAWKPAVPLVQIAVARLHVEDKQVAIARELLTKAIPIAEALDLRLVALARITLLEASMLELERPGDYPAKPDTMHPELSRLLVYAKHAVKNAGDEPRLAGMVALLEGRILLELSRHSPKKFPLDEVRSHAALARRLFEQIGDGEGIAYTALLETQCHLASGTRSSLDDAAFVTRAAAELLERSKRESRSTIQVAALRAMIAFERGDLEAVHAYHDALPNAAPPRPTGRTISGVVLDPTGKPASRATVISWRGELTGDARRVYRRPPMESAIVETGSDGRFTIDAHAAIIAQHGDLRSTPQAIGNDLVIRLGPTIEHTGTIDTARADRFGVVAFATYSIRDASWTVEAAVDVDRRYRLRIPKGTPLFGLEGPAGEGRRRVVGSAGKLAWPEAAVLDVVVRGIDGGHVWLFRGRVSPTTAREVAALAGSATDHVSAWLHPIGSHTTDAGRALYAGGDRHAIIAGTTAFGTVCVTHGDAATCKPLGETDQAVLIEVTASSGTR
jgi:hypothetical protein